MKSARSLFPILFMISGVFLQGCNPFMPFRPDSEQIVKKGWAKYPENQEDPEPIYCYDSLAEKVCHSAPLDKQDRLSGYYGPKP